MAALPRSALHWTALGAAALAAFGVTAAALLGALDRAALPYPTVLLEGAMRTERQLAKAAAAPRDRRRIVFLGDSLVYDMTRLPLSVPDKLAGLLRARGRRDYVRSVASAGFGAFTHYFLVDRVLEVEPDLVVLSLNLSWFSPAWRGINPPNVAGLLPLRRWPEALALPVGAAGLTLDRLALYRALMASGALPSWYRLQQEQLRVRGGWDAAAEQLQEIGGAPDGRGYVDDHWRHLRSVRVKDGRWTPERARIIMGPVFAGIDPDSPTLRALEATLAGYRSAGLEVIAYVAPLNVEHLRSIGVYDAEGLARSIAQLRSVARGQAVRFLDLHGVLPDAAFEDENQHLHTAGPVDGAGEVAARLLPLVLAASRDG